jgi:ABC-type antimicrobial peptide transport system permease subunit
MNSFQFVVDSLRHHRRMHIAVGLGVAVATAVLTGALLVGDSVRGSLRDLTLERLGRIDEVLVAGHFFREALASELAAGAEFQRHFVAAEPAILLPGTLQSGSGNSARRATQVSMIGISDKFWSLGEGAPGEPCADGDVAITDSLARELAVQSDDSILLRVPALEAVPADSPLGEKNETSLGRRLRVASVLPPDGLARFGLQPSQRLPRNVFVPLATLQEMLNKPGRANAILVAGSKIDAVPSDAAEDLLKDALRPRAADYGLRVESIEAPTAYVAVSSDQLVLADEVVTAAEKAFPDVSLQPVVTYLANSLVVGTGDAERKIPYSTITGVNSTAALGPLLDAAGQAITLADDEIALNRWAADDLQAKLGDAVTVNFYEPESTHGVLREHRPAVRFRLAHIAELAVDGVPTAAADPRLTPELPGVTDQTSISDWDLPFELVETIRQRDEDYWDQYRTTPKAFVSLATAKRLWASRWGTISLLRVPPTGGVSSAGDAASNGTAALAADEIADRLAHEIDPAEVGMTFLPVKRMGLDASSGTTPFDGLFLGFSFFLIAAAVMLIALLFKLGVEQRASELGILAAVGLPRQQVTRLLAVEGLIVAAAGALIGVVGGMLYAGLMIAGLRTWWVAAVATPFLTLHVSARSLMIGWLLGTFVSWLTIRLSIRRLAQLPTGRLLSGATEAAADMSEGGRAGTSAWPNTREALVALAVGLAIVGYLVSGQNQAIVFFGSGTVVLALLLGEIRYRLRTAGRSSPSRNRLTLAALSALNTSRHPGRSTLTVGLVATATFLIVAISAFRLDTGEGGTGGFAIIATSDQPIHFDLNTPAGRRELGFSDQESGQLEHWRVYSLRVATGEDASCLNLYRPTQPRVLGLPASFMERGGFAWAGAAEIPDDTSVAGSPWTLLDVDLGRDDAGRPIVPAVLDMSTAVYSLHLGGIGARMEIHDADDRPVTIEVVGLLANSVLQGNLLVSEANFLRLFPDTGGYGMFLIEATKGSELFSDGAIGDELPRTENSSDPFVDELLESKLADEGFDAADAREQLAGFLAVQNTYLSTFQSLGALGLLLGTVGLAVVQLRSVLERRGELALMRAGGFRRRRLVGMVLWENGVLLVGGLLVGILAAAIALVPQSASHQAAIPWATLLLLLGTIAAAGLLAGWLATRSALNTPIVAALRGD